jgi:hypothetical protein
MFFIPFFLKQSANFSTNSQDLGVLTSDTLSMSDEISNVYNISTITVEEDLNIFLENLSYKITIIDDFPFSDNLYLSFDVIAIDYLFKLSYSQITSITLEDFLSARFLPDYHTIEYLAKDAQVDRYSVSKILVSLSNLLRECKNYDVRQINAISLRIHKATMNNNKTVFVITEY